MTSCIQCIATKYICTIFEDCAHSGSFLSARLDGEGEVHRDAADGIPEEQRDHPRGREEKKRRIEVVVVLVLVLVVGQERPTDIAGKQSGARVGE